jgi:hypothetical protein
MTRTLRDSRRTLLLVCCSVVAGFIVGYPLKISILRLHSPRDYAYNYTFWFILLFLSLLLGYRSGGESRTRPFITTAAGLLLGYLSSFVGYGVLLVSLGQQSAVTRDITHLGFLFVFPLLTFGWAIGGIAALSFYLLARTVSRETAPPNRPR